MTQKGDVCKVTQLTRGESGCSQASQWLLAQVMKATVIEKVAHTTPRKISTLALFSKWFIRQVPRFIGLESYRKLKGAEIQDIRG